LIKSSKKSKHKKHKKSLDDDGVLAESETDHVSFDEKKVKKMKKKKIKELPDIDFSVVADESDSIGRQDSDKLGCSLSETKVNHRKLKGGVPATSDKNSGVVKIIEKSRHKHHRGASIGKECTLDVEQEVSGQDFVGSGCGGGW